MSLDAVAYQRAAAQFGETIVELADEEWELTTHPDDWTVITTVAWVVVGDAQLSGGSGGPAVSGDSMRPSSAGIPLRPGAAQRWAPSARPRY